MDVARRILAAGALCFAAAVVILLVPLGTRSGGGNALAPHWPSHGHSLQFLSNQQYAGLFGRHSPRAVAHRRREEATILAAAGIALVAAAGVRASRRTPEPR